MIDRPMKPQWYHILLALADKPLHGFGIQRAVLDATAGHMTLWPAMLYRSLATLEDEGMVEQVGTPPGEAEDERRQYYALTGPGRARLKEETDMLADWVRAARNAVT